VAALKEEMQAMGASYTAMSGSGSSVFGIFKDEATATATRAALAVDVRSWLGPSDAALSRS